MDKACKICGRVNPLWSDEYCHIGCAYNALKNENYQLILKITKLEEELKQLKTV